MKASDAVHVRFNEDVSVVLGAEGCVDNDGSSRVCQAGSSLTAKFLPRLGSSERQAERDRRRATKRDAPRSPLLHEVAT